MNTPPKKRRFVAPRFVHPGPDFEGVWMNALTSQDHATRFALIVSRFTVLEGLMSLPLAILLGGKDPEAAGYVLRSIINQRTRIDLMDSLLQRAPHNALLDERFDVIAREFSSINRARNEYVHGHWFTRTSDDAVSLADGDAPPIGILKARIVTTKEMDALAERMDALAQLIYAIAEEFDLTPTQPRQDLRLSDEPN